MSDATTILAPRGPRTEALLEKWKRERRVTVYNSFLAADHAWSTELQRIYGPDACDARFEARGQGVSGSALRRAYNRRADAYQRWRDSAIKSHIDVYEEEAVNA
jgi:hypothetical protein